MSLLGVPLQQFLARYHLSRLESHWWTILLSACFWQLIYMLSYRAYENWQPGFYKKLSAAKKLDWAMHHVSFLHAVVIFLLSLPMLTDKALVNDRIFGYSYYGGQVLAVTTGYFLWDSGICLSFMHLHGPGFAFHAIACFVIYLLSFVIDTRKKPIFQYFGGVFLSYELSTPFLNIHWFCDKTGRTGSRLQMINGLLLILAFFSVRLVFGYYESFVFFTNTAEDVFEHWDKIPKHLIYVYSGANILLNGLNAFWFFKMLRSAYVRSRGGTVTDDRGGHVTTPTKKSKKKD